MTAELPNDKDKGPSDEGSPDDRTADISPTVSMEGTDGLIVASGEDLSFSVARSEAAPNADQTVLSESPPFELASEEAAPEEKPLPEHFLTTGRIPIGTQLGHFVITKYIGGGGMGRVYEGIDKALDRKVAIKLLPRQRAQDAAAVARFLNEARSAARLNHEHIAQVYFCGQENGIPYIAFEYVEGINVRAFVEHSGPMPLAQAVNFLMQIAGALAHAATHGVTHRDVKPSNILITPQGKAKLIDMGLARLLRPSDPEEDLTVSGVTLGTFDYISPEQARDPRLADVRSDIYSLGCTFFFMLTGRPPFPEGTVLQKLLMHQGDDPPDIRTLVPGTPKEVSELILKMMAKDPANRFQTPNDLIVSLTAIARSIGLRPTGPGKDWVLSPKNVQKIDYTRHLPWITAVALLLLSVGAFRFFWRPTDEASILPKLEPSTGSALPAEPTLKERTDPKSSGAAETVSEAVRLPTASPLLVPETRRLIPRLLGPTVRDETPPPALAFDYTVGLSAERAGESSRVRAGLGIAPLSLSQALSEPILLNQKPESLQALRRTISTAAGELFGRWTLAHELMARPDVLAPAAVEERPVVTVDRIGAKPNTFASLDDALDSALRDSTADAGSTQEFAVELAYEGTLSTDGVALDGRSVRLTARRGFRPRLAFVPKAAERTEKSPSGGDAAMFALSGGRLTLSGIEIDFEVPASENDSRNWTLFELTGASSLLVKESILTIRNGRSDDEWTPISERVSFCRTADEPARPTDIAAEPEPAVEKSAPEALTPSERLNGARIDISRVLAHGEAVFCTVDSNAAPVGLEIASAGFCLTGPLVSLSGTAKTSVALDRTVGICLAPLFQTRQTALSVTPTLNATVTRSLIRLDGTALGETIYAGSVPATPEAPRWLLAESIIYDASALAQFRSESHPEQSVEYPAESNSFYRLRGTAFENLDIKEILPHRFSSSDLTDMILRPAYNAIKTEEERSTLDAIESGIFGTEPVTH